jgi:hypothetical protein
VNSVPLLQILIFLWLSICPLAAVEISNLQGQVIEVEILDIEPSRIEIRLANDQEIWYERAQLSEATQAMLAAQEAKERSAYLELNHLLGIPLFSDGNLWDDPVSEVAERLQWPLESQTDSQSSYRKYSGGDYKILNCRAYSAALYGEAGQARRLSLVFANKGDFRYSDPPSDSEIDAMEASIQDDLERIEALLIRQLGEAERQQFGAGRGIKQLIQRWDWKTHAFLLASQDGEYVNLKIMHTQQADNKGRGEKLSDAALRALSTENLCSEENGDVRIGNIPMVDQGPKGYCVPATFERYLRYMQIPADMYILAMAGQTKIGGGTSLSELIESIDGYISSQSRSMKELKESIKLRTVQKYIDQGLPIIWTMCSSRDYNEFVNQRSLERLRVTDWKEWKERTKSDSRKYELRKDYMSAHACMIIGYNKETDEIAVSDSWGPSYAVRWVPVEQAEQVSLGSIYVIGF